MKVFEKFAKVSIFLLVLIFGMVVGTWSVLAEGDAPVPGEYIVLWQDDEAARSAVTALRALGGHRVAAVPGQNLELWAVAPARAATFFTHLSQHPGVRWVEPNRLLPLPGGHLVPRRGQESVSPNDPYYATYAVRYLAPLGVEDAWGMTQGDPRVVVAVIDTGVDCAHPDLQGACWRNEDEVPDNGIDDDGNGYVDDVAGWNFPQRSPNVFDVHYHGTHVAGIVAARANNGIGIVGIAPRVTIMPLVIFQPRGVGTYFDLIRAIFYAVDNGAQVINMSLGATSYSLGEALAVRYAEEHGVVVVAAAGNTGRNVNFYPAAHPTVIAVAALTASGEPARFSNWGNFIDVAAPGVSIMSTIPGGRYGVLSGTSMAAPHVAGLAALLLSRNPRLSPAAVRATIERTAEDQAGPSLVDPPGRDVHYGYGRIHVARALAAVPPASFPESSPLRPAPQLPWRPLCLDVVVNGGFEKGMYGWEGEGARLVRTPVYEGHWALRFDRGEGEIRQRLLALADINTLFSRQSAPFPILPRGMHPLRFTFFLAVRVESQDGGYGTRPDFPFDDWITVSLERVGTDTSLLLMQAGNTSDRVEMGLEWDTFFGIFPGDLLGHEPPVGWDLVIRTGEDGDDRKTAFTVDDARLCVVLGRPRAYLPRITLGE